MNGNEPAPVTITSLEAQGVRHGFFGRSGGVSSGIYASLNCGRGSRDVRQDIEANRMRVAELLGVSADVLIGPRQIHSAKAIIVDRPWMPGEAPEGDAIVTATPGIAISVLTADCAPVLLHDAEHGVAAAVHAGWKGAKAGVIEAALNAMMQLGARVENVTAAIGPAISAKNYEVGFDFEQGFLAENPANELFFKKGGEGVRPHFDLPAYVAAKLKESGIQKIEDTALCTYENESNFFSHRRSVHASEGDYGRQISVILL